jgi:hypothetical protein
VTLQLPRKFKNRFGVFSYRHITKDLFSGFYYHKETFEYAIAYPHKAIFDYLYYHTNRFTKNIHPDILEDLRIDTDELSDEEKGKLENLLSKYTSIKINI